MKLHKFLPTICLLLLLGNIDARACWEPYFSPYHYYMYRVYDTSIKGDANSELWQQLTSKTIPLDDILEVVYRMPLHEYEQIYDAPKYKGDNQFMAWIKSRDKESLDFLLLAKTNEHIRLKCSSRWYYPTMKIDARMTLEEVAERSLANHSQRLRDRYLLQAVRALFTLGRYDECIGIWDDEVSKLPAGNLMRSLIYPYIAGAVYRTGDTERACFMFAEIGDVESLAYCANTVYNCRDKAESLALVCKYNPNSPYILRTLQSEIRRQEDECSTYFAERLIELSMQMARDERVENPALWYYTAAFMADRKGSPVEASELLALGEKVRGTTYIKESIKVLRIYLDAKTLPYNAAYERRLHEQLVWLDNQVAKHIDDQVRETTTYDGWKQCAGYNYYYWNDMMRRVLLAEVCPRMIDAGKTTRALQLANMADNRLYSLVNRKEWYDENEFGEIYSMVGTMPQYRCNKHFNYDDYSNHFFALIDSIGVDRVIAYYERTRQPKSDFDRFLNARGYITQNYLCDILGTQCLRNMRYADAVKYLSCVQPSFVPSLNVELFYNPFSIEREQLSDAGNFRYNFAREMHSLEQKMQREPDVNKRAELMVRYAKGLKNSVGFCWQLTQYFRGGPFFGGPEKHDWESAATTRAIRQRSEELVNVACRIATDREWIALMQYDFCNFATVAEQYPDTEVGAFVKGACDKLVDYYAESADYVRY